MDVLNQILNINAGGAYGGGKAGGAFDPLTFVMKPQVVIRALCWVSAIEKKNYPNSPKPTRLFFFKDLSLKKYSWTFFIAWVHDIWHLL